MLQLKMKSNYRTQVNNYSAFDTAAYYLGYKDRTVYELKQKLSEKGYSDDEIAEAMDKLQEYGYVNDSRYARLYIKQNSTQKGSRRLINELKQKGIDKELSIEEAMKLDINEIEVISNIFNKRFAAVDLSDDKQYRRVYSFFVRRGFNYDNIAKIIAIYRKNNEN